MNFSAKNLLRLFLIITLAAFAMPANAFFYKGSDIQKSCDPEGADYTQAGICVGFILGIADTLEFEEFTLDAAQHTYCPPADITATQLVAAVKAWQDQHTDDLHFMAAQQVQFILTEAFPCDG